MIDGFILFICSVISFVTLIFKLDSEFRFSLLRNLIDFAFRYLATLSALFSLFFRFNKIFFLLFVFIVNFYKFETYRAEVDNE